MSFSGYPSAEAAGSITGAADGSTDAPASNRASWRGLLRLSLVALPIRAYPAVLATPESRFHQLHLGCGQRVRYEKHCPVHGKLDASAITKGYEYSPGEFLVLDEEELQRFRPARDRALCLERIVDAGALEPALLSGRSLHLLPDGPAARTPYSVLAQAMAERNQWAIGRIGLSGARQPVIVRARIGRLILHVLHYSNQLRACPEDPIDPVLVPSAEECALAGQLIDSYSGPVNWEHYCDTSAGELAALVEAKLRSGTVAEPAAEEIPIVRFADALKASIQATLETTAESDTPPDTKRRKRRSRRTA